MHIDCTAVNGGGRERERAEMTDVCVCVGRGREDISLFVACLEVCLYIRVFLCHCISVCSCVFMCACVCACVCLCACRLLRVTHSVTARVM